MDKADNATDATQDDVVRELRGRDQVFSFRLGAESIQRKTLECRAADEIERLRAEKEELNQRLLFMFGEAGKASRERAEWHTWARTIDWGKTLLHVKPPPGIES